MATTAIQPKAQGTAAARYAVTVRRARGILRLLLGATVAAGVLATVVGFFAVQDTLGRYREIVADSARSADAAQAARAALLGYHSDAADFLSQQGSPAAPLTLAESEWRAYQEALRRLWENRSDAQFGEFAVFDAADTATLRYKGNVDAMLAFVGAGDRAAGEAAFLRAHDTLVREVVPALNGLEAVKLESMEAAYATTNAAISRWQQILFVIGGAAVALLLLGFALTRFWLHYRWTWELALAALAALALFVWFNGTLLYAASRAEVLVRDAYDSISGVQGVAALLTQADALESLAIFDPTQAPAFLSDADEYLDLVEQRLCGEFSPSCVQTVFTNEGGQTILPEAEAAALAGQSKYGLPRAPLVADAAQNNFRGEPQQLEALRGAIQRYRAANDRLASDLAGGEASTQQRLESQGAYTDALAAASAEQALVRAEFERIYRIVNTSMEWSRWLALGFSALAALGFLGLRRRRDALFA